MPIVFDEINAEVISRPSTSGAGTSPGSGAGEKPLDLDEIRRRLERTVRLASRLEAD